MRFVCLYEGFVCLYEGFVCLYERFVCLYERGLFVCMSEVCLFV